MLTNLFFLDNKIIKHELSTVESSKLLSPSVYLSSLIFQNFLKCCKPDIRLKRSVIGKRVITAGWSCNGWNPLRSDIILYLMNSTAIRIFKDTFATNSVLIQIRFLDLTKENPSSACDQTGQIFWQSCLFERQILNVIQILRLKSP